MSVKKKIRSYLVFASTGYRLVMFIAVPLLAIGIHVFSLKVMEGSGVPVILTALILLEIMADHWFLGGIQEKNAEKLDYLKTSPGGMQIMKSVLILDFLRRFLEAAVIFGACWLISLFPGIKRPEVIKELLVPVLEVCSLSIAGTLITRFESYLGVNMLTGYIAAIIGIVCYIFVTIGVIRTELFCGMAAVLGAVVSILAVKLAMKRLEESYYDK